jgi:hypothetical protein
MIPPYYINNIVTKQTGLLLPLVVFLLIRTTDSELLCVEDSEYLPLSCHWFLRHKFCINSEQSLPLQRDQLKQEGYKCFKYTQKKGDMIITWPGVYDLGINIGWNLNEAVNFRTRNWLEEAKILQPCMCFGANSAIVLNLVEIEPKM